MFVRTAADLAASPLVVRGGQAQLEMSWTKGGPTRWTSREPAAELLDSLVIRVRPFLLEEDPAHLFSILKICDNSLRSDQIRSFLADVRQEWATSQRRTLISLNTDGRDIRPDLAARLWLYGYWFHPNGPERAELEAMFGPAKLLTRHMFLDYVYGAAEAALAAADAVRVGLEQDLFDR